MSVRVLFSLLFLLTLLVTVGFIYFTLRIVWMLFDGLVPEFISVVGFTFPAYIVLVIAGVSLLFLLICLFSLLFLLMDRLIIRPLKIISTAMHEFAEHSHQTPLPEFSRTTNEVKWLSEVFVEFASSVERIHEKDVEISRMKSDFISTAAHQLRTPMTGIRWSLEALQKSGLSPDQQALADSATNKTKDLVAIIGTLLDISAIESGKYNYHFEPVQIENVLEHASHEFSEIAQARGVTLIFVKTGKPVPLVRADTERLKWILNNLIENAIRYTPAKGSVQLSVVSGFGKVFVKVKDSGIGIREEDRANIFERFFRASNAIEKENAGNGLGLYIARTIAKDHGGDLNFESNPDGPGTTFTLTLLPAK